MRAAAPVQPGLILVRPAIAGTVIPVAKTSKTATSKTASTCQGRLSRGFWRLLGATDEKVKAHSMAEVTAAAEYTEKAQGLDAEQLAKAAGLLNLEDLAEAGINCTSFELEFDCCECFVP